MSLLLFRTTSDRFLDLIINHPDVRPTIQRGCEWLSSLEVLTDHENVCLGTTGGAALFMHRGGGLYRGHIMLLDKSRGAFGLAFGRAALRAMHDTYGAKKIDCLVPLELPAARRYVTTLGFTSQGVNENGLEESFVLETLR